jgi:hypothetical protein
MSISNDNAHETLDLLPIIMTNTYRQKKTMKHLINALKKTIIVTKKQEINKERNEK